MKKSTQIILSFSVGLFLIVLILVLAIVYPCPTPSQYNIFRIIISIAVGAFATVIPGLFEFRFKGIVTAMGAIGVFAFVYTFDPAKLVISPCPTDTYLSGTVYVNNKETKGMDVRVNQLKMQAVTDEFGSFRIDYPLENQKATYNFRILYKSSLDTSFEISKSDWQNLKFNFSVDTSKIAINPIQQPSAQGSIQTPIQIPKKEIQNYFVGELPESSVANYGGEKYCGFSMKYSDIKAQIKLSLNRKNVQLAKVTFKAIEKANEGCPFQTAAPNTHVYDLSNATINGQNIFISFNPDHTNNPLCSLTLEGTISGNKIVAVLYSTRIDMPDPILVYKIRIDMDLEIQE